MAGGSSHDPGALLQEVIKEVTLKQLNLSMTKINFEKTEKECKESVKRIFEEVVKWARKSQDLLIKQVEDIAERRSREIEEISAALICLQPRLARIRIKSANENKDDDGSAIQAMLKIKKEASEIYPDDISEDLTVIEFNLSRLAQSIFLHGNLEELFRINCCLRPEQLMVKRAIVLNPETGETLIEIISIAASEKRIPKFILPEMSLIFLGSERESKGSVSLKTLDVQGKVKILNGNTILVKTMAGKPAEDNVMVSVTLSGFPIRNSPTLLIVDLNAVKQQQQQQQQQPVWKECGGNSTNVTRTGKPIDDLDDSDLISMGYKASEKTLLFLKEKEKLLPKVSPPPPPPPGSPCMDKKANLNLPLDQPSPLTVNSGGNSKKNNADDGGNGGVVGISGSIGNGSEKGHRNGDASSENVPCTSTLNNLSEKLKSISFPRLEDEEEDEDKALNGDEIGIENLLRIQKVLTGEAQPGAVTISGSVSGSGAPPEESKHDKSVSFHPNTTIMEPAPKSRSRLSSRDELSETKPYRPGTMDESSSLDITERSSMEELWQIRTGITKTTDGELALCKSIMAAQNKGNESNNSFGEPDSVWNQSLGTWERNLREVKENMKNNRSTNEHSLVSCWDQSINASDIVPGQGSIEPEFNLASPDYILQFTKQIVLDNMPQSIAKDEEKFLFVSHPEANKISVFLGWKCKGTLKVQEDLRHPRYVAVLPDKRLAVLDANALHIFKYSGSHIKTLLSDVATTCRGLEYYKEYGYLLTVQKTEEGSFLLVIDQEVNDSVVKRIQIEPSSGTKWHCETTRCLFLTCMKGKVFVSDYGLNSVYVVHLSNNKTELFCGSFGKDTKLKEARGVSLDPAGNLIASSAHPGKLEVFDSRGSHVRTLSVSQVKKPAGLLLDQEQRTLYVADTERKSLFQYTVSQDSSLF